MRCENVVSSGILEENSLVKQQSEEWKVVKNGGKMKMRVCMPATSQAVPCRSSFSSIREVRKEIKGKADEVSQSKGECKVKLIGDSLCRYLGKKLEVK